MVPRAVSSDRLTCLLRNRTPFYERRKRREDCESRPSRHDIITLLWHGTANIMFLVYDIVLRYCTDSLLKK